MTLLIIIIALAIIFDYINGFHDAANAIATVVSTKALSPIQAVVWAAFFNFAAFFIFKDHGVANTVAKTVKEGTDGSGVPFITLTVILAGLVAAITWNLLTWWFGIPSSSSHTLIGGFAGAAIAHAGLFAINPGPIIKIASFIFLAPLIGMGMAFVVSLWLLNSFRKTIAPKLVSLGLLLFVFIFLRYILETDPVKLQSHYEAYWLKVVFHSQNFKWILVAILLVILSVFSLFLSSLNYAKSERWFKRLQLLTSASFCVGHGGNDAQKVMGIMMAALVAYDPARFQLENMEWWVPITCYTAIALGTMSGGWKIMKTMGSRITKIKPFEGVAAETTSALTLFITESLKIPVSTTHTVTGAIVGVGATKRLSAVRWGVTVNLLWAWILTIPVSAGIAMAFYWVFKAFGMEM